jgi:hypothetical protein
LDEEKYAWEEEGGDDAREEGHCST